MDSASAAEATIEQSFMEQDATTMKKKGASPTREDVERKVREALAERESGGKQQLPVEYTGIAASPVLFTQIVVPDDSSPEQLAKMKKLAKAAREAETRKSHGSQPSNSAISQPINQPREQINQPGKFGRDMHKHF